VITTHARVSESVCEMSEREDIRQADRDTPGHVTPEVKNHALRPERDPPPKELMRLHNARTRSKETEDCGPLQPRWTRRETRLIAPAEINMGDALGSRQKEKENKMRKREKTEHAMRNPVQGRRFSIFCCLYMLILRLFYVLILRYIIK
jgi:hypothetical protein